MDDEITQALNDHRLSWGSKGLYIFLIRQPRPDYQGIPTAKSVDSNLRVLQMLRQLEKHGYVNLHKDVIYITLHPNRPKK